MKKRNRNTAALGADAEKLRGIADATRQMQQAKSAAGWDRAMKSSQRRGIPGVKLHKGWDAAFRRARGA